MTKGLRISKQTGGVTTLYRHDGQMGIEDVEVPASGTSVTHYGMGARGVDMIERTNGSGTVTAFPIYDAHGNNVASLTRSGTGFQIGDRRTYDAWDVVRAQQSGGDPKLRYCANLGHRADDESGLIYMRARYYEPASGRFVSQDPDRHGLNWFSYCSGDPVNFSDVTGTTEILSGVLWAIGAGLIGLAIWGLQPGSGEYDVVNKVFKLSPNLTQIIAAAALIAFTATCFVEEGAGRSFRTLEGVGLAGSGLLTIATAMLEAGKIGSHSLASVAVFASVCYGMRLLAELYAMDIDQSDQ